MLDAAALVLNEMPGVQFVIALASRRSPEEAATLIASHRDAEKLSARVRVVRGETREALAASDASAVCSGTATLEAALTGTPLVVVYKESALNWHTLGRLIEVEHYGLVNLIAGERVAPELLQRDFKGASLARELLALLDPARNARVRSLLHGAAVRLGEGGASLRAADAVLRAVRSWKSAKSE